jgi:acyl-CoA thioesterase I
MVDFWTDTGKRRSAEKPGRQWIRVQRLFVILVLLAALLACTSDKAPSPADTGAQSAKAQVTATSTPEHVFTIVALGDSLTAGLGVDENDAYPAVLQRRLKADGHAVRVVNAGISGETSSGAVSRLEWVLTSLHPDLVILETGANDGLRGIDTNILRANLDRLLTELKKAKVKVILAGMQMLPNLGPVYTSRFRAVYPQAAKAHDVPLIPFILEGVAGDQRYNQSDMLHPNAEGYRRVVDHIYPWVTAALP